MRKRKMFNKCFAALIIFLIIAAVGLIAADAPDQEHNVEPQIVEAVSAPAATAAAHADSKHEQAERLYTDADAQALAQMAWGECRGVGDLVTEDGRTVTGTCQKAAAMWVALNRYDAGWEGSIVDVVAAPVQFLGYDPEHPLDDGLLALAYDVLERWNEERNGGADVGRVIPEDYFWFVGDGKHNHFSNQYRSGKYYTWELSDAYVVSDSVIKGK